VAVSAGLAGSTAAAECIGVATPFPHWVQKGICNQYVTRVAAVRQVTTISVVSQRTTFAP